MDVNDDSTTFTYDVQGRLQSRAYPGLPRPSLHRRPERRQTAGGESFTYDDRGRLWSDTKTTGEFLGYTHASVGDRTRNTAPQGTTSYSTARSVAAVSTVRMKKLSILAFTPVVALLVPKSAVSQTGLACQGHSTTLPMVGSAPALIGDVLYFTTCAGRAIAVDYESGREVFDMDGPAKTITGDDALLVVTNAFSAQGLSRDSGTRVWQVNTDGSTPGIPKGRIVAYPIVSGDIVLLRLEVASEESVAHEIIGLDREDGRPAWRFRLNGRSLGEDMFASDGTVLVSDGRHAYGINRNDGTMRWTAEGTNVRFVGISSSEPDPVR